MNRFIYLAAVLLVCTPAQANNSKLLVQSGKWSAYEYKEDGKKVCYMISKPVKEEGTFKKRGQVYAMITHRPGDKSYNVVSFHAGYPYAEGSSVHVIVGKDKYEMFTANETAWTQNEDDGAIVNSIKKGETIIVTGKSAKGTESKDTYSLKGSTQAYQAISKACGVH
jgi:hypothetical protein